MVDATSPFDPEVMPPFEVLWSVGAHSVPVPQEAQDALLPFTRWLRERGAAVSGPELLQTIARFQHAGRAAVAAHAEFDAVLTPTLAQLPRPVGWFSSAPTPAEDFERQKRYTPYNALYNVTGQPAISLPLHWTDDGPRWEFSSWVGPQGKAPCSPWPGSWSAPNRGRSGDHLPGEAQVGSGQLP